MGIAWFDAEPPAVAEPTLRTGGLPLLEDDQSWPTCAACQCPMLFRAQIPLALTSLVSPVDERLLLVFECHGQGSEAAHCKAGAILFSCHGKPRAAPRPSQFDLQIQHLGPRPAEARRLLLSLTEADRLDRSSQPPFAVPLSVPHSIADQALALLGELGAGAELTPSAPTILDGVRGGHLVPFDDGPSLRRSDTTLPPLQRLRAQLPGLPMRGLIGGSFPGRSDASGHCRCGKRWRTAVRLMGDASRTLAQVPLPPAVLQLCLACENATLVRS